MDNLWSVELVRFSVELQVVLSEKSSKRNVRVDSGNSLNLVKGSNYRPRPVTMVFVCCSCFVTGGFHS